MNAKGIIFFHLIIWLLLAVGCASKKTNRRLASTTPLPMELGMPYDSLKNKFVDAGSCINIPEDRVNEETGRRISSIQVIPPKTEELTVRLNVNSSQLAKETLSGLGTRLDSSKKMDSSDVGAVVKEFAKISNNRFTSNIVYSLKLSGGKESIDPQAELSLDLSDEEWGTEPEKIERRRDLCGDSFLFSKELGANLQAVLTFEFDNEKSKKSFDAQASLEIGEESVRKNIEFAKENSKISLDVTQFGGDPQLRVFSGSCGSSNPNVCIGAMASFFEYVPKFKDQFKNENGEDLGLYMQGNYTFKSYDKVDSRFDKIGLEDKSRKLLESYRNKIVGHFADEYSLFLRGESLFNRSPKLIGDRDPRIWEIQFAQRVLLKRMEAITHAIRTCYGLDVEPESKMGNDSIVRKCESMKKKLNAFLYDNGDMDNTITCKANDPGLSGGEDPLAQGQAKNWFYPMIKMNLERNCTKIAKADIKFDPSYMAIYSFTIREWLQKYDKWFNLLVKSKISKDQDTKASFKASARKLLSEAELFSLFQILRNGFYDSSNKKIDLKYEEFDVFDSMDNLAVDETDETWKKRKWIIPIDTIMNIENITCKSLKFDKGTGVERSIQDLYPLTSFRYVEAIDLSQNRVKNLTPLRQLSSLSTLFLDGNPIKRLSVLGATPNRLEVLSLKNLPNLKKDGSLDSGGKKTVKLQNELAAIKGLRIIDLSENSPWPVQEIANTPGGLPKLGEIYLVNLTAKTNLEKSKWTENIKALLKSIIDEKDTKFPSLWKIQISIEGVNSDQFASEGLVKSLNELEIEQDFSNPTSLDFSKSEPCKNN